MTTLYCRHCGGEINSESKRVQCAHCGALFPFACYVCNRNLRTPFPIFEDERYLTLEEVNPDTQARVEPHPLCQDHFLRKCPDCGNWFHAHENPGYFRCASCAAEHRKKRLLGMVDSSEVDSFEEEMEESEDLIHADYGDAATVSASVAGSIITSKERSRVDINTMALAGAGGALIGLVVWFVLNGFSF